jgi:hypothetical protein
MMNLKPWSGTLRKAGLTQIWGAVFINSASRGRERASQAAIVQSYIFEASMGKKYKSEILGIIHQNQSANLEVGAITEKQMREWDEMCLVSEPVSRETSARTVSTRPASPLFAAGRGSSQN